MANVPNAAGVPSLLTGWDPTNIAGITFLTADTVSGLGYVYPTWGIFSGGSLVVSADTVIALDYKQDWVIADYPLERGAFETYDKVSTPFDVRVRFVSGGSDSNRAALLDSIASIAGDYGLYDVATPEVVYTSCNIRHYDYHRTSNRGLGLITVDVWLQQIRVQGASADTVASPSGAPQINDGMVQPSDATSVQDSSGAGFD